MGRKKINLDYDKISQEYLNGEELKPLAKKYNVSHWTLLKNFKKLGIRKNTKRHQNFSVFNKYTEESCYWAGFLMADGFVNKYSIGCELSIVDRNHLEKLKSFLKSNATIREKNRNCFNKIIKTCVVYFYSSEFSKVLKEKFNIIRCKSLVCRPPNIPSKMLKHYIRGYIDGDGSLGWHKHNKLPRLNCCSGSKHMINFIYNGIINNINVGNPKIRQRNSSLYGFEFNGMQALKILDWLYGNSNIYLDRKYGKYISYKKHIFDKKQKEQENKKHQLNYFESLYLSGMSIGDISDYTGKTYGYVRYYLKKSKIDLNKTKMSGLYGNKIRKRDLNILEDYNSGMTALQLSVKYGIAKSTIRVALRRAN